MPTSPEELKQPVNAATQAAIPSIPTPLKDNLSLTLSHQITKVFPAAATSFDAFRVYADSVFAIEYQRVQIEPIVSRVSLAESVSE